MAAFAIMGFGKLLGGCLFILDRSKMLQGVFTMDPLKLRYTKTHEWAAIEGNICTVGLTKFAVDLLTDVIYIDMPDVGDPALKGDSFGEIESVKAVSDIYAPVDGEIVEVNDKLVQDPAAISKDPFGKGWLVKIKMSGKPNLDHLMNHAAYEKQIASESH